MSEVQWRGILQRDWKVKICNRNIFLVLVNSKLGIEAFLKILASDGVMVLRPTPRSKLSISSQDEDFRFDRNVRSDGVTVIVVSDNETRLIVRCEKEWTFHVMRKT